MKKGTPGAAIDLAFFRLRRIGARPLRTRRLTEPQRPARMSNVMVVQAVRKLSPQVPEVTVGAVAEAIGAGATFP